MFVFIKCKKELKPHEIIVCEICRFYSYKYHEVLELDDDEFETLYLGMNMIKARETLSKFTECDWSNMKSQDRNKLHRDIYKTGYPLEFKQKVLRDESLIAPTLTPEMMRRNGRK